MRLEGYKLKGRTYLVPSPSRKGFQWKASALHGLQRLDRRSQSNSPTTVVVPALYNMMPAEVLALGWLSEIDSLGAIRQRMTLAGKQLGWDVFSFHTRHSRDKYFDSAIHAVRETWLYEGALTAETIAQTRKKFGNAYDYHRCEPRLVENLLIQSSLMDWLTVRAAEKQLRFHVVGTGLLSALVWCGALTIQSAIRTAVAIGKSWDAVLDDWASSEIQLHGHTASAENHGWLRYHRVRQIIEGKVSMALPAPQFEMPNVDVPQRPFWYSPLGKADAQLIESRQDVLEALQTMTLVSWAPEIPKPLNSDGAPCVRAWLASPMHPIASACHWSMYNYLLATPASSMLFLNHIATQATVMPLPLHQTVFDAAAAPTYPNARTSEIRSAPGH